MAMTNEEAQAELMVLRGLASSGNDLALVKERIDRLYWEVCRKHLRTCRCKDKYKDALFEIYAKLRTNCKNNTTMAKARLVNGVVLRHKGNHYTNANLTDKVAREFLAEFPQRSDWFAELPEEEQKAEVPENGTQVAPKAIKKAQQPTTPKKEKAPKKGK